MSFPGPHGTSLLVSAGKVNFHIECRPVISTSIFPNISISTLFPSVSIFSSHILQHFQVQLRICHGPKAASAEHLHLLRSPERLRQGPAVDTGLGAVEALTLGTWQGKPRETHLLKCPTYPQKIPKSRYFRLVLVEFIQMHPLLKPFFGQVPPLSSRSPRSFGRPGLLQRVERLRQGFAVAKGLGTFPAESAGCHSEVALRWPVEFVDLTGYSFSMFFLVFPMHIHK